MSDVRVKDLDDILNQMSQLKVKKDELEEQVTTINKEYSRLLFRAGDYLKELNRENYDGPAGKVEVKEEWRVRLPDGDIEKQAFFNFLRERGIFDKFATVNSNSLNALYRQDWETAKSKGEGMTFTMPGISAPVVDRVPKFKPAKAK